MLDSTLKKEPRASAEIPTPMLLRFKILVLFGTRPEAIKLAPVIHELEKDYFQTVIVSSSQHRELLAPFLETLRIEPNYDLSVMTQDQTLSSICARVLEKLDTILETENPGLIVVQGDTTTALAGALAGFNRKIPVAHVEAGLRSGNLHSPFPEEMNRRLISQIANFHFAATETNRNNLVAEQVPTEKVFLTGNTVVDALRFILANHKPSREIAELLFATADKKRILLTTHRRESFGETMVENLRVLRDFVERRKDVCLIFPVHPNPNVRAATHEMLHGVENVHLLEPLDYGDFVTLMKAAWLIISDSGGIQEEAPSLGKPLFILRQNTERPEAIRAGIARLVGGNPRVLRLMLEENYAVPSWIKSVKEVANPFGDGLAARRIVKIIEDKTGVRNRIVKTA